MQPATNKAKLSRPRSEVCTSVCWLGCSAKVGLVKAFMQAVYSVYAGRPRCSADVRSRAVTQTEAGGETTIAGRLSAVCRGRPKTKVSRGSREAQWKTP